MARLTAKTLIKRILLGVLWGIASVPGGYGLEALVRWLERLGVPTGFIDVLVWTLAWTILFPPVAG
jgi:hypothetical protein